MLLRPFLNDAGSCGGLAVAATPWRRTALHPVSVT